MKKYASIIILACILVPGVAAVLAAPVIHRIWTAPAPQPAANAAHGYTAGQKAILADMIRVIHREMSMQEFYASGHMDAHNPADSGNDMHAAFTCSRRGQEYYYHVGDQEMAVLPGLFIAVNHDLHKMSIGEGQQLTVPPLLPEADLEKMWEGEDYEITADTLQGKVRMRLLCERHVSCKEFRMEYDTAVGLPSLLYMRMTDLEDPLNKETDKIYQLTVNEWNTSAQPGLFVPSRYVSGGPGHWTPAGIFSGYALAPGY